MVLLVNLELNCERMGLGAYCLMNVVGWVQRGRHLLRIVKYLVPIYFGCMDLIDVADWIEWSDRDSGIERRNAFASISLPPFADFHVSDSDCDSDVSTIHSVVCKFADSKKWDG